MNYYSGSHTTSPIGYSTTNTISLENNPLVLCKDLVQEVMIESWNIYCVTDS